MRSVLRAARTLRSRAIHLPALLALAAPPLVCQAVFPRPVANPFEARVGCMWQIDDAKLRLDIGSEVDLFSGETEPDSVGQGALQGAGWRVGGGVQTWTRLRSEANFKFPVETADFWFGVHAKYGYDDGWHVRLRLAHISSHMVDGLADTNGTISPKPFVYSREFGELLCGLKIGVLRPYAGFTLIWATQPKAPSRFVPQGGVDVNVPLGGPWWLVGGYDVRLVGIDGVYAAANAAQLGVKLDTWHRTGLMVGVYGYSGRSMHGMFYTGYDQYLAIGFQVLW